MMWRTKTRDVRFARLGVGLALAAAGAFVLVAQSARTASRDAYRDAYRVWHEADPNLERDAATAGAPIGARADRVVAEASAYYDQRREFFGQFAQENVQKLAWLAAAPPEAGPARSTGVNDYIAAETGVLRKSIDSFARDPDPAIQQVRNRLERENIALNAVGASLLERERAAAEADTAVAAVDEAWRRAFDRNREMTAVVAKSAASLDREKTAWVEYYRMFSDAARATTSDVVRPENVRVATPDSVPPARSSEPVPRTSITPVPLIRYTGDWIFPQTDGLFHGLQPEGIDLSVHEENGHGDGHFEGRFKLPAGSSGDPLLKFEIKGEFTNTRVQHFTIETSDGSQGTIDLIPGPAFNLLEINVQVEAKPGKIRQVNTILVKK